MADGERSRREALAVQQSKLLVPVVSAAPREKGRPKLKGPAPPAGLRGAAVAGPARARGPADEGPRAPPMLGLKGRVLRPSPAASVPAPAAVEGGAYIPIHCTV